MNRSIPPAEVTLDAMRGLLTLRRAGKIKRITFLKTWGKLRQLLTMTKEYQAWRQLVKTRAGGACEECGNEGQHAHHIEQISRNVDRALDPRNGRYLCIKCHAGQPDHHLRRTRSGARSNSRSAAGHRSSAEPPARHSPNSAPRERAVRATSPR